MTPQEKCVECGQYFDQAFFLHPEHLCPSCKRVSSRCRECKQFFVKEVVLICGVYTLADLCGKCRTTGTPSDPHFMGRSATGDDVALGALPRELWVQVTPLPERAPDPEGSLGADGP